MGCRLTGPSAANSSPSAELRQLLRDAGPGAEAYSQGAGESDDRDMLTWAIVFLVVAIIAGAFGFSGMASAAAGVAKILFFVFVAVFIITLVLSFLAGAAAG